MIVPSNPETIALAVDTLRAGDLVAFPTETVYGLGGNATSDAAVSGIFKAKQRPPFNPLIVHVASFEAAEEIGEYTEKARQLAMHFWPGPMSLVVKRRQKCRISRLATAGLDTICVRIPAQPVARAIMNVAGFPIAAPSANASGRVSPTPAMHVDASLGDSVGLILDDGPCELGLESTVIDCSTHEAVILRPGALTVEEIEALIGPVTFSDTPTELPVSPGLLASHYAPEASVRRNVSSILEGEALLSFGKHKIRGFSKELNLSPSENLQEAAGNLFSMMQSLDHAGATIAVMPIPEHGLGRAINDRLRRAAAPRGGE